MIEILEIRSSTNAAGTVTRHADIAIGDGLTVYKLGVGGLPESGDLQPILDAREAKLLQVAIAKGQLFDVYELTVQRVLKALTLVITDELNILRALHGLPDRTADQIKGAIKNRLKDV